MYAIVQKHPEFEISCLVRNSDKGAQIASQYSRVRLVYGELDSVDILEEEARKADIVIRELLFWKLFFSPMNFWYLVS